MSIKVIKISDERGEGEELQLIVSYKVYNAWEKARIHWDWGGRVGLWVNDWLFATYGVYIPDSYIHYLNEFYIPSGFFNRLRRLLGQRLYSLKFLKFLDD